MLRLNILLVCLFLPLVSLADGISIYADPAKARLHPWKESSRASDKNSAWKSRVKWKNMKVNRVSEWQSYDQVVDAFKLIRRTRAFQDPTVSGFMRRITWLYWVDGCFTRAGLASRMLMQAGYPDVSQVYVFGNLYLKKKNHNWNYRVAPAVRVKDKVYVLDVTINAERPLEYSEWHSEFLRDTKDIEGNICDKATWDPNQNCSKGDFTTPDISEKRMIDDWNNEWMSTERKFLKDAADLNLGDHPPWYSEAR